jgi:hypothetical protein
MQDDYDPKKHRIKKLKDGPYIQVDRQIDRWRAFRKAKWTQKAKVFKAKYNKPIDDVRRSMANNEPINKEDLFALDIFGTSEPDFKD